VRSFATDPYADGVYENADGSPKDITSSLCNTGIGGGSKRYAKNWASIFGKKKKSSTEAMPEGIEERNVAKGEGDYTIFEPDLDGEWKEVQEGDICPGGLEYRLNMETGEKLARLPPSEVSSSNNALSIIPATQDEEDSISTSN
jgi:hypothetical protein